jgi:F0F1-type ATP synthase assembly protein I
MWKGQRLREERPDNAATLNEEVLLGAAIGMTAGTVIANLLGAEIGGIVLGLLLGIVLGSVTGILSWTGSVDLLEESVPSDNVASKQTTDRNG